MSRSGYYIKIAHVDDKLSHDMCYLCAVNGKKIFSFHVIPFPTTCLVSLSYTPSVGHY